MTIIVLGASGKLGRKVVELALKRGHSVTAFVRDGRKLEQPQFIGKRVAITT
jgi:uncharacterized protein